jgi:hypothetical protein
MSRWVALVVVLLVIVGSLALLIPFIQKLRIESNLEASKNNLKDLAFFAAHNVKPDPNDPRKLPKEIPAATIVLPGVAPEDRLSWVVHILPGLDQRKNPTVELLSQIKQDRPWTDEANQQAARTRLVGLLCPENTPRVPPGSPAVTSYVGIAGLGTDAATLALPPQGSPPSRAGAFRYDAPTPLSRIEDGLSQTLLLAETAASPGPWLRGGFSTTRGLDDSSGAAPLIGGQFGGYFPSEANFALCDGSVRTFSSQMTPQVLYKMATIAGGKGEMNVVE